jgi:prolyl 4-hydroxylase
MPSRGSAAPANFAERASTWEPSATSVCRAMAALAPGCHDGGVYAGHFDFAHPLVWTVDDFLSAEECEARLAALASAEWLAATVNSATGRVVRDHVRSNTVAVLRDPADAERLYARFRPHVPARLSYESAAGRREVDLVGLKSPLRVYRYEAGQSFGVHQDQSYPGEGGSMSRLTFMVYLNDDFEGGHTTFPTVEKVVVPLRGRAVFFQHAILHAGEAVASGTKYVLRSDVLYSA